MQNLDTGPSGLFICWQAAVLAVLVVTLAEVVKRAIDAAIGRERRHNIRWITIFLLPVLPIVLGIVVAILTPIRPEWLTSYVEKWPGKRWTVFGAWGACVGQFSDYFYGKIELFLKAKGLSGNRETTVPSNPPAAGS